MDVVALGELLIDFACLQTDGDGYPMGEGYGILFYGENGILPPKTTNAPPLV